MSIIHSVSSIHTDMVHVTREALLSSVNKSTVHEDKRSSCTSTRYIHAALYMLLTWMVLMSASSALVLVANAENSLP